MNRSVQLDEEAVLRGADDQRVELLADALLHELDLLPLHQLALGIGGAALGLRAFVRDRAQIVLGTASAAVEHARQQPVHDQVRIAADGRREVRVGVRGQREMADVLGAVARLLQRAQHQVAQDALLRLAFDLRHQLLIIARTRS